MREADKKAVGCHIIVHTLIKRPRPLLPGRRGSIMASGRAKPKDIDDYIASFSPEVQAILEKILFGIQSSQDVKLSNIARSLQEEIPLIRTEKRLSRNLKSAELEKELTPQLVRMGSSRIQPNTVLALDLSDIRKEYAQKMENLATVRDGSTGELQGLLALRRDRGRGQRQRDRPSLSESVLGRGERLHQRKRGSAVRRPTVTIQQ